MTWMLMPFEAKVTLTRVPDRPGAAAGIFGPLAEAAINVDMIVQNVSVGSDETGLTFTVPQADLARAVAVIEGLRDDLEYGDLLADPDVVKVSVIGVGMRSHAGVAQMMFATLAEKGIQYRQSKLPHGVSSIAPHELAQKLYHLVVEHVR